MTSWPWGSPPRCGWDPKENLQGDVDVTVERIDQSTMKDFAAFKLDKALKASTPYYVHVKVKNTAATNLSGVELPIFLDNGSDVLFPSARITSSFKPCPSRPLPEKFTQGKKADLCLVFLAAPKTKLEAIAMRPTEQTEPITWTGKITKAGRGQEGLSVAQYGVVRASWSARVMTNGSACMYSHGLPEPEVAVDVRPGPGPVAPSTGPTRVGHVVGGRDAERDAPDLGPGVAHLGVVRVGTASLAEVERLAVGRGVDDEVLVRVPRGEPARRPAGCRRRSGRPWTA